MAKQGTEPLEGIVFTEAQVEQLRAAVGPLARLAEAAEDEAENWTDDDVALAQASLQAVAHFLDGGEWYVDGMKMPAVSWRAILETPRNQQSAAMAAARSVMEGLLASFPKRDQILQSAVVRTEAGQILAEEARERKASRDQERAAWIVARYESVRGRFVDEHVGDIRARQQVARDYTRATGRSITDRTVRNILDRSGIRRKG